MDLFTQFVIGHGQDDTNRLLLDRGKWPGIDMDLAVHTIEGRRRMRLKMPLWHAVPELLYPTRLCTEQCSSAATARCKARVAARILSGGAIQGIEGDAAPVETGRRSGNIADLTGGLGVDAWAFSEVAGKVLHNEMDPVLSEAVRHNFRVLGISNAVFRNACAEPGRIGAILGDFHPDLIFLDPARRATDGRKVFRLEDCQPDVLTLKDELLRHAPHLLLKISPMADISFIVNQLNGRNGAQALQTGGGALYETGKAFPGDPCLPDVGNHDGEAAGRVKQGQLRQGQEKQEQTGRVRQEQEKQEQMGPGQAGHGQTGHGQVREVHVVEADGECKELLIWIDRDWDGPFRLVICNADRQSIPAPAGKAELQQTGPAPQQCRPGILSFDPDAESGAKPEYVPGPDALRGGLLFEPGKALSKAGLFNTLCSGTGLLKLARHTHLYLVSPAAVLNGQDDCTPRFPVEKDDCTRRFPAGQVPAEDAESPGENAESAEKDRQADRAAVLSDFGKFFRIKEIHPFSGKTVKAVGKAWPRADVSAKDLPLSSDELRKRLGVISDASVHIFGCRVACPASDDVPARSGNRNQTKGMTEKSKRVTKKSGEAPKDSAWLIVSEPV